MRPLDTFVCENVDEETAMKRSKQLCEAGYKLCEEGKYHEAIALFQEDMALCTAVCGVGHSYVANSLLDIADCYRGLGQFEEALQFSRRALEIFETGLGPEHRHTARGLSAVSMCHAKLGQSDQAIPLYRRVLDIREKIYGAESDVAAWTLCALADLHNNLEQYEQALPLCQRALTIHEKIAGAEHPDTLECMANLVSVYEKVLGAEHAETLSLIVDLAQRHEKLGQWKQALPLRQQAMGICERLYGSAHADTLSSLYAVEWVYAKLEQWADVLCLRQRALEIEEKTLGAEHPDVIYSRTYLANTYEKLERWDQALPLRQQVLSLNEKIYGTEHVKSLASMDKLACAYEKLEQWEQALPLREHMLILREKIHGTESRQRRYSVRDLARVYENLHRYELALPLRQHLLARQEIGLYGRNAAMTEIGQLADLYEKLGQHEQAQLLRQEQRSEPHVERPAASDTADSDKVRVLLNEAETKVELAQAYGEMGEWADALEIYQEALATREAILGSEHLDTLKVIDRLVEVYEKLGNIEQIKAMLSRRMSVTTQSTQGMSPSNQAGLPRTLRDFESRTPEEEAAMKLSNYLCAEGRMLRTQGKHHEALALFQQDRALCEKVCGAEHSYVANSDYDMALCYEGLGQYAQALLMYQQAVVIHEKAYDAGHWLVSNDLEGIANCSEKLGTSELANLRMAYEKVYGAEYAKTLNVVCWFAYAYERLNQEDKAIALLQRELAILENDRGTEDEHFLDYSLNLAWLYKNREQWDATLPLLRRDLALCESRYGAMHPRTLESVSRLAWLYAQLEQWDRALPLDLRALKGNEQVLGADHIDTLNSTRALACTYYRLGQWQKELPLRKRALRIAEKFYGLDNEGVVGCVEDMAGVYERLGHHERVLPLLQRVIAIQGEERVDASVLLKVAELLERSGQGDQALDIRQRTYPRALRNAGGEAELFESFERIRLALSVCVEVLRQCEKIDAPENPETQKALLEFAAILQRLSLTEEASRNPESMEALLRLDTEIRKIAQTEQTQEALSRGASIRNILAQAEPQREMLANRAVAKASELIARFAQDVEGKHICSGYWQEYDLYPLAHHAVLDYLEHLWAGGEKDESFEQKSLKNDFKMKGLNFAALCYIVAKQRNIPFDKVLHFLAPASPEADDPLTVLFQKIMVIAPAMNEEGLSGEIKCLAGVVCGSLLDSKLARYSAAPIDDVFDSVDFVVRYCKALELLKP